MLKKSFMFIVICACLLLLSGCYTIIDTVKGAVGGLTEGVKKDFGFMEEADDWMQENLW